MSDINKCLKCNERFYMDDGEQCTVCETVHCGSCSLENGISFHDLEGSCLHICKSCIDEYKENGIEYIQSEINGVVTKDIMDAVVLEFDAWSK